MDLHPLFWIMVPLLGLFVGSFFNVAIHRWPQEDPKEREWVRTRSHCPKCHAMIHWYDNVPLLSFLLLKGKCRACHNPISWRYPAVELGTALLWLLVMWLVSTYGLTGLEPASMTGWHIAFAITFASFYMLTVIIDFMTQLIPDEISWGHLAAAWLFLFICAPQTISGGWLDSLIGMFVLAAFFFVLFWFGGMGLGDVKLALGMGVLFGWKVVLTAGFVSILIGGLVAVTIWVYLHLTGKYRRKIPIAFGPYLAIGSFICLFTGGEILNWYLSLF